MWISSCRSPITLMTVLVIVHQLIYLTSTEDTLSTGSKVNPMFLHSGKSLKVEVIVILPDSSNASLGFSKSLNRALNSMDDESSLGQEKREPILWRVKNFVIVNDTNSSTLESSSSKFESLPVRRKLKKFLTVSQPASNISFSPDLVPEFCDFLEKTKPIAIVDFVGNYIGGEKILSIISSTTALPLIGSQYETKSLHKDKYDYFISLSASVRQVAQALGHFLIHCHWHTFSVIFDDSPSVSASQGVWESVLLQMKVNQRQFNDTNSDIPTPIPDFYDYERIAANYPEYDGNDDDEENSPGLNPKFITMQSRKLNGAIRALSHLTKLTQGVVVLICSQNSLFGIFRAAQKLRMLNGDYVFIMVGHHTEFEVIPDWIPSGVLALRSPQKVQIGKHMTKKIGKLLSSALHSVTNLKIHVERKQGGGRMSSSELFDEKTDFSIMDSTSSRSHLSGVAFHTQQRFKGPSKSLGMKSVQDLLNNFPNVSCWKMPSLSRIEFSHFFTSSIRDKIESQRNSQDREVQSRLRDPERLALTFDILNLISSEDSQTREWTNVGNISMDHPRVNLRTIQWPGGGIFGPGDRLSKTYRIVTVTAPPFVMEAEPDDNKTCVIGLPCLKVNTTNKDELEVIFADFVRGNHESSQYKLACCDGFAMDLLTSISRELKFEIDLFLVPDGYFGELSIRTGQWNGLINVLLSGSAHMSFAPLSVTSERATAVDFSTPFFFSGVGFLGMAKTHDVPLMAFLAPFSYELWAAIFLTLNLTALAVALFEWLSPFGLNPWGRQRTKNFSIASALWVVWGRLFSHLVAFKAPKSWPNKFLINVWGGFSVIFVASYTANIAALFAGKFFQRGLDVHDRSLLIQRVATIQHSATDFYIRKESPILWDVVRRYQVHNFQEGVDMLKNGTLDLLIGDGPLLDYYRGSDSSCSLIDVSNQDKIGDDTYAVAMTKGFPLRESISVLISKYIGNGYLDYLQGKWYGQLECFRRRTDFVRARALGVDSVAGMIIMLGLGTLVGILILGMEHIVYKYALPYFRSQPKGTLWRSPNIMFFSQKLYRFINCVELVSPHHAAKELVNTLKQGQITSLFQKSVKRKEHEQRRRRRSKAQFFEMIQEIRRVQKREKQDKKDVAETNFASTSSSAAPIYSIQARLERNRQTPKVVRILGVEAETIHEAPEPEEVSEEKASSSLSISPPVRRSVNNADEIHMHVFYV